MTKRSVQLSRRACLKGFARLGIGSGLATLMPGSRAVMAQTAGFTPYLLLVYASGGWDTTMVFDNKIGIGEVAQESGASAATTAEGLSYVSHPARPSVNAWFNAYGANAAIVRGLNTGSMQRQRAASQSLGAVPDKRWRRCDWLSFYAAMMNPSAEIPHLVINAPFMPGEYAPVAVHLSSAQIAARLADIPDAKELGAGEVGLVNFLGSSFTPLMAKANNATLDGEKLLALYYGYARDNAVTDRLRALHDELGKAPENERELVRHGKMAVEMFAQGKSQCATLQAGATDAWNTLADNFVTQSTLFEHLFADLISIFAYAKDAGVLDKMTVIVMSERGRAAKLNAHAGKGPWPYTSALVWGVGIKGGAMAGETDALLRGLPYNPAFGGSGAGAVTLEMGNIMAGVYLKANAPGILLLPTHQPLSTILTV